MKIKKLIFNPFQENTYLIYDDAKECIIIDPGCQNEAEYAKLKKVIDEEELKVVKILNTHLHLDHILGNYFLTKDYDVEIFASPKDNFLLSPEIITQLSFGMKLPEIKGADQEIKDGEIIETGNIKLKAIKTAGHSPGSLSFYEENTKSIFSGDVLFRESIGRTDLPGGDYDQLILSIKKLFDLPHNVDVYPGHGPVTSIGYERLNNPFLISF